MKKLKEMTFAVVGATGNVGRTMLSILAERGIPAANVHALASSRSAGRQVSYGENDVLKVMPLEAFDFSKATITFSAAGSSVSAQYVPHATAKGTIVIDKTSLFRMDKDVPLIVPEVNPEALAGYTQRNIIAVPNCNTIPLMVALKPLHALAKVKRVVCSTYQSVSGAGKVAMDELMQQTKGLFVNQNYDPVQFSKPIAFNVIPQIDSFMADGSTKEEWKMTVETKKILDEKIELTATCVRVPVFIGHAVSATVEFDSALSATKARQVLKSSPGIVVIDDPDNHGFMTPAEIAGEDAVYVSRIREDKTVPHGLSFWVLTDNIRKGAALNAMQIAELLVKDYL